MAPTIPTPSEWRRRTWYGRVILVPELIVFIVVAIATVIGSCILWIPIGYARLNAWLGKRTPEVYRDTE